MNPEPKSQRQLVSATCSTALDLWVDIVSDIIVAEVLREQQSRLIDRGPEHGPEETQ